LAVGFSAAAVRAGLAASGRAATGGAGWLGFGAAAVDGLAAGAGFGVAGEADGLAAAPAFAEAAGEGDAADCELFVTVDEGAGDVGRAPDADDDALFAEDAAWVLGAADAELLAGGLADGLPPEEPACWSAAEVSHVDDSLASLSGVEVGCAWTLGCGGPELSAAPFAV
jgi:hypothetical protein